MSEPYTALPILGISTEQGAEIPSDVLAKLPQAERDKASAFVAQIDPTDVSGMRMYGAAEQGALASFVDRTLPVMLNAPTSEADKAVAELKTQLARWDARCSTKNIFAKLWWMLFPGMQVSMLRNAFSNIYPAIEKAADQLFDARVSLMRLAVQLEQMQAENESRFDRLTAYVAMGKLKLKRMQAEPQDDPQWKEAQQRLERRVYDLMISRQISLQVAAQMTILLSSARLTEQQLNTTLTSTIPLWKTQAVILLGIKQQEAYSAAQQSAQAALNKSMVAGVEEIQKTVDREKAQKLHQSNRELDQSIDAFQQSLQNLSQKQRGVSQEIQPLQQEAAASLAK